jgi:hypothetical protein
MVGSWGSEEADVVRAVAAVPLSRKLDAAPQPAESAAELSGGGVVAAEPAAPVLLLVLLAGAEPEVRVPQTSESVEQILVLEVLPAVAGGWLMKLCW